MTKWKSYLKPAERFVVRSGRPLKNGETVRVSILSKAAQQGSAVMQEVKNAPDLV